MKDFYKLEEDFAIVELSKNIYPLVVIQKTISNYLEQTYIKLEELDNKIIIKNPRKVTEEMLFDFYKKSNLPEKSYFKAMAGITIRGFVNVAIRIFEDKVNKENVDLAFSEFKDFLTPRDSDKGFSEELLGDNTKIIYNKFIEFIKYN